MSKATSRTVLSTLNLNRWEWYACYRDARAIYSPRVRRMRFSGCEMRRARPSDLAPARSLYGGRRSLLARTSQRRQARLTRPTAARPRRPPSRSAGKPRRRRAELLHRTTCITGVVAIGLPICIVVMGSNYRLPNALAEKVKHSVESVRVSK